jgi:lysozyme
MNDQPKDLGKDNVSKIDNIQHQAHAGEDALRQEYFSPRAGTAQAGIVIRSNEQRLAQERVEFKDKFEKQNIDFGTITKGWSPYKALEELVKDHKIKLTEDQVVAESRRIRDRDFAALGRKFYNPGDKSSYWSNDEINKHVDDVVNRVKGVDVYKGDKDIDWKQVKTAGYQFAFLKASEGITIADDHLAQNRKGALEAGMRIGYYHYFRPNDSVDAQVKNFVTAVGKPDNGALRLVVDLEEPKIWKPYSVDKRIKMIDDWCKGVTKALGVTPTIAVYGSPNFFKDTLKNSETLGKYDLWIADYRSATPEVPKPWNNWTFFQYSEHGKVAGIQTDVDLDMYNGSDINQAFAPLKARK